MKTVRKILNKIRSDIEHPQNESVVDDPSLLSDDVLLPESEPLPVRSIFSSKGSMFACRFPKNAWINPHDMDFSSSELESSSSSRSLSR